MSEFYILDGHKAVPCKDSELSGMWMTSFDIDDRRVALTELKAHEVSTVFLGIDHNFGLGPPLLFETMVFNKIPVWRMWLGYLFPRFRFSFEWEADCRRYSTWEEAEQGHQEIVEKYRRL